MSHLIWPWRFIDLEATFIDLDSVWSSIWHNLKFVILLMLCVLRIWLADSAEIETFKVQINDIRWLFHFFFYRYYLKVDLWLNYGNTSVTLEDRGTSRSIPESSVSNRSLRSWELTWGKDLYWTEFMNQSIWLFLRNASKASFPSNMTVFFNWK